MYLQMLSLWEPQRGMGCKWDLGAVRDGDSSSEVVYTRHRVVSIAPGRNRKLSLCLSSVSAMGNDNNFTEL